MRKNILDGHNGPAFGLILDHIQLQDLIDVEPDRKTAKARFRYFLTSGVHESISGKSMQFWEGGLYENQYVREDGIWKFKLLTPHVFWKADYETGWAHSKPHSIQFHSVTYPKGSDGPDALENPPALWPDTDILPYHYPHPVTGKWVECPKPVFLDRELDERLGLRRTDSASRPMRTWHGMYQNCCRARWGVPVTNTARNFNLISSSEGERCT